MLIFKLNKKLKFKKSISPKSLFKNSLYSMNLEINQIIEMLKTINLCIIREDSNKESLITTKIKIRKKEERVILVKSLKMIKYTSIIFVSRVNSIHKTKLAIKDVIFYRKIRSLMI